MQSNRWRSLTEKKQQRYENNKEHSRYDVRFSSILKAYVWTPLSIRKFAYNNRIDDFFCFRKKKEWKRQKRNESTIKTWVIVFLLRNFCTNTPSSTCVYCTVDWICLRFALADETHTHSTIALSFFRLHAHSTIQPYYWVLFNINSTQITSSSFMPSYTVCSQQYCDAKLFAFMSSSVVKFLFPANSMWEKVLSVRKHDALHFFVEIRIVAFLSSFILSHIFICSLCYFRLIFFCLRQILVVFFIFLLEKNTFLAEIDKLTHGKT